MKYLIILFILISSSNALYWVDGNSAYSCVSYSSETQTSFYSNTYNCLTGQSIIMKNYTNYKNVSPVESSLVNGNFSFYHGANGATFYSRAASTTSEQFPICQKDDSEKGYREFGWKYYTTENNIELSYKDCIKIGTYNNDNKTLTSTGGNVRDWSFDPDTGAVNFKGGNTREIYLIDGFHSVYEYDDYDDLISSEKYDINGVKIEDKTLKKINDELDLVTNHKKNNDSEDFIEYIEKNSDWANYAVNETDNGLQIVKKVNETDSGYQMVYYNKNKLTNDEYYRIESYDNDDNVQFTQDYQLNSDTNELVAVDTNDILKNLNSNQTNPTYTNLKSTYESNSFSFETSNGEVQEIKQDLKEDKLPLTPESNTCKLDMAELSNYGYTVIYDISFSVCNSYKSFDEVQNVYYLGYDECGDTTICLIQKKDNTILDDTITSQPTTDFNNDEIANNQTLQDNTTVTNNNNSNIGTYTTSTPPPTTNNDNSLRKSIQNLGTSTDINTNALNENTKALKEQANNFSSLNNLLNSPLDTNITDNYDGVLNFMDDIKQKSSNVVNNILDVKNVFDNGFSYKLEDTQINNSCFEINFHNKAVSFNPCPVLQNFKPILVFIFEIYLIFLSVKILINGIREFKR
jgi:hypothetical protein